MMALNVLDRFVKGTATLLILGSTPLFAVLFFFDRRSRPTTKRDCVRYGISSFLQLFLAKRLHRGAL